MRVRPLEEQEIAPPTQSVLQRYLGLGPPGRFTLDAFEEQLGSSSKARQFGTKATRSDLLVRIDRGEYVAVDPSVAIRAWAIPGYYAELLVLHDALDQLDIGHAFACLPATIETDLIFDRPWLVTPPSEDERIPKVDRFTYDHARTGTQPLEVLGRTFQLPVLQRVEAALVLASTGLPREVEAARSLVETDPPDEAIVPAFNYVGLDLERDNADVEDPGIAFPAFIAERRQRFGEELLREGGR